MNEQKINSECADVREQSFKYLGLSESILERLGEVGFEKPTEIQSKAIPTILGGSDVIGQAQTGSGKTGAFVLPALEGLKFNKSVEVLVLVPTRELASQVVGEFQNLGDNLSIKVVDVVGGLAPQRQIELINRGAQVVVATPGRLYDHLRSRKLKNFRPTLVVLDEADEMLAMNFIDDVRKIFKFIPKERQTLLFSATMPQAIKKLSDEILTDPAHIKLVGQKDDHADIKQQLYVVKGKDKEQALIRILDAEEPEKALIFCRTRRDTNELFAKLSAHGIKVRAIHGELNQNERNRAIQDLRSGSASVLVATDVASRGLDITNLSHVFNYDTPESRDRYLHRIGRTGRAGRKGKAITLATPGEMHAGGFYGRKPALNLNFERVPDRKILQQKRNVRLLKKIKEVQVPEELEAFCKDLLKKEDAVELVCKLYAHVGSSQTFNGPNQIGLTPEEISRLNRRSSNTRDKERRAKKRQQRTGRKGWQSERRSRRKSNSRFGKRSY